MKWEENSKFFFVNKLPKQIRMKKQKLLAPHWKFMGKTKASACGHNRFSYFGTIAAWWTFNCVEGIDQKNLVHRFRTHFDLRVSNGGKKTFNEWSEYDKAWIISFQRKFIGSLKSAFVEFGFCNKWHLNWASISKRRFQNILSTVKWASHFFFAFYETN